ncbi:SDR family oxidoreductase [Roseococcus pinisoli]|uniref:SDR family oxidoreductase n=1 Tax=Roseococcus pinisoli TaxID=2835040 RepID=A0ABS5Q8Q4_9PROT|nr:SDR family oxidoreductase [Roseococcus pinisoli]MBS7809837.1 SDR family oxidoreductase [Roseococcus pinisoli]
MRLATRTAFITGGSSGIGLATARLFVSEGAQVVITGRNPKALEAAQRELGEQALAVQADSTDAAALEAAVAAGIARFGKLDIVFANAGIGGATPLGETGAEAFSHMVRNNLDGSFLTVQAALPHLGQGASVILNGSVHAVLGVPGWSAYAAAKAGLRAMSRVLAAELAPRGIRVNLVVPGGTRTPIWSYAAPTEAAMDAVDAQISRAIPLGKMGAAEDIAKAVLYLASEDARHVTAAEIVVDGGHTGAPAGAPIYRAAA